MSDPLIIAEVFAGLACHHVPVGLKSGGTADFSKMLACICRLPRVHISLMGRVLHCVPRQLNTIDTGNNTGPFATNHWHWYKLVGLCCCNTASVWHKSNMRLYVIGQGSP